MVVIFILDQGIPMASLFANKKVTCCDCVEKKVISHFKTPRLLPHWKCIAPGFINPDGSGEA